MKQLSFDILHINYEIHYISQQNNNNNSNNKRSARKNIFVMY